MSVHSPTPLAGLTIAIAVLTAPLLTVPAGAGPAADPICEDHDPHPPIRITEEHGPDGFTWTNPVTGQNEARPGSGVVAGDGTADDPFVIAGWCFPVPDARPLFAATHIENTDSHVVIRDNLVPPESRAWDGIKLVDVANVTVAENILVETSSGDIIVGGSTRVDLTNNAAWRVRIRGGGTVEVTDNTIYDGGYPGVDVGGTHRVEIVDNTIRDQSEDGIRVSGVDEAVVVGNAVRDNEEGGVDIRKSGTVVLRDNVVADNGYNSDEFGTGVFLRQNGDVRVVHNTIDHNAGYGLRVGTATVRANAITDNQDGGVLTFPFGNQTSTVHANNFERNEGPALKAGSPDDTLLDATDNWWDAASGPSGGVEDACTGTVADGVGGAIEVFQDLPVDVCFDPWRDAPNPDAGARS